MERKKKVTATVISQQETAAGIYDMWLETGLAEGARPGQFVAIYPQDGTTLLPRPISICEAQKGRLRLVYRVVGKGTREFAACAEGQKLSLLGVLGNGFPLEAAEGKKALLLGGGIGIPPLVELAKQLPGEKTAVAGYRDGQFFLQEDLQRWAAFFGASEDGSRGVKGNVLDCVREKEMEADVIYACGPMPMLRAIKKYALEKGIPAYISLEERMACGIGACLGCVCRTVKKDSHSHVNNARICTEGPVFEAKEVDI